MTEYGHGFKFTTVCELDDAEHVLRSAINSHIKANKINGPKRYDIYLKKEYLYNIFYWYSSSIKTPRRFLSGGSDYGAERIASWRI